MKFEIGQQAISNPQNLGACSPMNRESWKATPIRKHTSSKKQYQKRLDKANAKITGLEKKFGKANLKNA